MIDTPAARRPDEDPASATFVRAHAAAGEAFDMMLELFPLGVALPPFADVRRWYVERYKLPVELKVQQLSPDEVTAQGNGLAACLMCVCVVGIVFVIAVAGLYGVFAK